MVNIDPEERDRRVKFGSALLVKLTFSGWRLPPAANDISFHPMPLSLDGSAKLLISCFTAHTPMHFLAGSRHLLQHCLPVRGTASSLRLVDRSLRENYLLLIWLGAAAAALLPLQRCVDCALLHKLLVHCMVRQLCPLQTLRLPPTEAVCSAGRVSLPS